MMLSAILKRRSLFLQLPGFSFSNQPTRQYSLLHQQILKSKTWNDFYSLFSNKKGEFTKTTFYQTAPHIKKLLQNEKVYTNAQLAEVVEVIQKFDISTVDQDTAIRLLSVLQNLNRKGLKKKSLSKTLVELCNRYIELLSATPEGKQRIGQMINAYYQMAYFERHDGECLISDRLVKNIQNKAQKDSPLTTSHAVNLFRVFSIKEDFKAAEFKLRLQILQYLANKIDDLAAKDLADIMKNINRMTLYDASGYQNILVNTLGNKLIQKINELLQADLFGFLQADNFCPHPVFLKIYEEILKNAYSQLEQNGNTQFKKKNSLLRLFSSLSFRFDFSRHSAAQKQKFINFLSNRAKELTQAQTKKQDKKLFYDCLQDFMKNRYYLQQDVKRLASILLQGGAVRVRYLQLLYNDGIDVRELLPTFLAAPLPYRIDPATAITHSTLIKRLTKDPKYAAFKESFQNYLPKFTQIIEQIFQSLQNFTSAIEPILKNDELRSNLRFFQDEHQEYFNKLPNPFQDANSSPENKLVYLSYVLSAFRYGAFYKFISQYNNKIEHSLLVKLINAHTWRTSFKPSNRVLILATTNLPSAFKLKEKGLISATLEIFAKYNPIIVSTNREGETANYIVKILEIILQNSLVLKQLKLDNQFFNYLARYVQRNSFNYKNEEVFRQIITLALQHFGKLPNFIIFDVASQALRLNIFDKKYAEEIDLSKWNGRQNEKNSLSYLKDPTFTPTINLITPQNLQSILFNPNLQNLIEQKESEIIKILEKSKINKLFGYIAANNQPATFTTYKLVTKILTLINFQDYQSFQCCDFQGAIKYLINIDYHSYEESSQLCLKIITLLTDKMSMFSLSTHFEAIRFATFIPGCQPEKYYAKLLAHASEHLSETDVEQLLYRLSSTSYRFDKLDLKYVRSLLKKNTLKGVSLFLASESQRVLEHRKEIAYEIMRKIQQAQQNQAIILNLQYDYLKKAYPQQTKELELKPEQLHALRPKQKILNFLELIAQSNKMTLETVATLQKNYIIKINNFCLVFFNQKQPGSIHQQQLIRKDLPVLFNGQQYIFVFVDTAEICNLLGLAKIIQKQVPQLITGEVKQAVGEEFLRQSDLEQTSKEGQENQSMTKNTQNVLKKPQKNKGERKNGEFMQAAGEKQLRRNKLEKSSKEGQENLSMPKNTQKLLKKSQKNKGERKNGEFMQAADEKQLRRNKLEKSLEKGQENQSKPKNTQNVLKKSQKNKGEREQRQKIQSENKAPQ